MQEKEMINHPDHYLKDTGFEVIDVIEAWNLDFSLGNAIKYIARAGKKNPGKRKQDLEKALWYIERTISNLRQKVIYNKKSQGEKMTKVLVEWSFEGTEFEDTYGRYDETCINLGLPKRVNIELDEDEDEENIKEYLEEQYGFEVDNWEIVEDQRATISYLYYNK